METSQERGAAEPVDPEIIVIDKPFLTRPRLFQSENMLAGDGPPRLSLSEQLELLRDALRPFAELRELFHATRGDRPVFSMKFGPDGWRELTIDDFRRARSALEQTKP